MMNETQMSAYLGRMGLDRVPKPDADGLAILIRMHLEHIPFENLDIFEFHRIPSLEEEALYEKIVAGRRGGVCFELNTLFFFLLRQLGCEVYPVAARVLHSSRPTRSVSNGGSELPPLSHMGLIARIGPEPYYCDVGYGGPGPKGLVCLRPGEQAVGGELFRIAELPDGEYQIQRKQEEEWKCLLQFEDRPVRLVDFRPLDVYCAKDPEVLFTRKRVVNLCTPGGSKALTDQTLTVRDGDSVRRETYEDRASLEQALKREFGLDVNLKEF